MLLSHTSMINVVQWIMGSQINHGHTFCEENSLHAETKRLMSWFLCFSTFILDIPADPTSFQNLPQEPGSLDPDVFVLCIKQIW